MSLFFIDAYVTGTDRTVTWGFVTQLAQEIRDQRGRRRDVGPTNVGKPNAAARGLLGGV